MTEPAIRALIAKVRDEIAQHCASFFWNDVDIGLLHAKWRDELEAALVAREAAETPSDYRAGEGIALIAAERHRQLSVEGWSPEHDDLHDKGQIAISAARYALEDVGIFPHRAPAARYALKQLWQWESCWWKPKDPIRNLVRAGALIAAEIDRRLRAASLSPAVPPQEDERVIPPFLHPGYVIRKAKPQPHHGIDCGCADCAIPSTAETPPATDKP